MHIAVDGSLWGGEERGVAVATRRLWQACLRQQKYEHVTVFAPKEIDLEGTGASRVDVRTRKGMSRLMWQQFALPALVRGRDIDLLHCLSYTAPITVPCNVIVTVHDLIVWTHPRLAGWRNRLHLRLLLGHSMRRAEAVCVPTDFVRRAIVGRFNIPARKVFVVPWGADAELAPLARHEAIREVRRRFDVDEPFVLFCGCIETKKNLPTAIRVASNAGLLLLVVGPRIPGSVSVFSNTYDIAASRWRYLGYVSNTDLSVLYSAAIALLFPSAAEGFGLPVIEAMRCGCPVIASTSPALLEVCRGAAIHFPHSDVSALTHAVQAVATDRSLRETIIGRGVARAADFTWKAAVERFAEAVTFAQR